jgi:hypothetical protein
MGKELDAMVAEKIMGWYWDDDWDCLIPPEQVAKPSEMYVRVSAFVWEPNGQNLVNGVAYNGDLTKIILPNYSTDISDAWKIVERMTQIPRTAEEAIRAPNTQFALWFDKACLWAMTAQEVAQAICENALKIAGDDNAH